MIQRIKDKNTYSKTDVITMTNWSFLHYWLYAAFPHCYGLQSDLSRHFPYSYKWVNQMFQTTKDQEVIPIRQTIVIDQQTITILLYRYHIEYRIENQELFQPCLSYPATASFDNDTFFFLLPIVDLSQGYSYPDLVPDLLQRFSETALPAEYRKDIAYALGIGLADADGAEDCPLWTIWQETKDALYGAEWWPDEENFHLFQQRNFGKRHLPDAYFPVPEGEEIFLWGKHILSQWISSWHA